MTDLKHLTVKALEDFLKESKMKGLIHEGTIITNYEMLELQIVVSEEWDYEYDEGDELVEFKTPNTIRVSVQKG